MLPGAMPRRLRPVISRFLVFVIWSTTVFARQRESDGLATWTVHQEHGTPVLRTVLIAKQPQPLRKGTSRGFHPVVHMHAPASSFPGMDLRSFPQESERQYHVVPLFGGIVDVGEFYAKVDLGGQIVHLQIDTGSATMAAPMAECQSCLAGDRRYNILKSTQSRGKKIGCEDEICSMDRCSPFFCGTCSSKNACCARSDPQYCGFHLSYGDGSGAKGVLVQEFMTWGGVSFPTIFGGIESDSPDFEREQVDGILGLAYPPLACNPSCVVPTFDAMVNYLSMKSVFQICTNATQGALILGDYDETLGIAEPAWVPMMLSEPPSYFTVELLSDLKVNGQPLKFRQFKSGIFDSGSTLIVLKSADFSVLLQHMRENYCHVPGICDDATWFMPAQCTELSQTSLNQLPSLSFQLDGFELVLGPTDYLVNYASKGPNYWCVGIMQLGSLSGGIDIIFGNTVMKKYVTIFDRENSRIGIAESTGSCDSRSSETAGTDTLVGSTEVPDTVTANSSVSDLTKKGNQSAGTDVGKPQESVSSGPDVFAKSAICAAATDCGSCSNVTSTTCIWDISARQCKLGNPYIFMCVADFFQDKVALVVGVVVGLVILIVLVTVIAVCAYRRRQDARAEAAVDVEEAAESRVPLAPGGRDTRKESTDPIRNGTDEF